jgi:hypothetical protein
MADLISTVKELNEESKMKCIYVLIAGCEMFASTNKKALDDYLESDESLITPYTDIDNISMIYGFQMDIEKLPFELSSKAKEDRYLWVLIGNGGETVCEMFDDLEEVVGFISGCLHMDPDKDISDFSVVLGVEVDLVMTVGGSGPYISESIVYD